MTNTTLGPHLVSKISEFTFNTRDAGPKILGTPQSQATVSRSPFNYEHSRFDLITPLCVASLSIIGVFFIYSAQHYQQSDDWLKQIVWIGIGLTAFTVVSFVDYKIFLKYSHWLYALSLILLALVPWSPLGKAFYGARRWLDVGIGPTFQPSELAKLACIVIGASLLTRSEIGKLSESRLTLAKMTLAVSVPFLFILFQPDLGSALIIPTVMFAQLYASNLAKSFFTTTIAIGLVLVGLAVLDTHNYSEYVIAKAEAKEEQVVERPHFWIPIEDYQRQRIMGFIYPDKVDRRDAGWNREQSIISVGSGGVFGKGWLNGNQAQLGYLPRAVAHNDFIFSVIAEETGFLGSVVVVSLFGLLIGNNIRIATIARDRFGTLLVIGVATLFSIHFFVNIAMTIGLMPITGLPLPFLSHGGTFMVSCCVLQGLAQSVYRFRKEF